MNQSTPTTAHATMTTTNIKASDRQVGGTHYKNMAIQPMEFCMMNKLDYATSNIIKYVIRQKGDKSQQSQDLRKAMHCIQLLAEHRGLTL